MLKPRVKIAVAKYETESDTKFSRMEAAKKLGISPQYLSGIISGKKKNVDPEVLFGLAKLLNCKVDDLYEYCKEEDG
ncbi:helix-turn-helix domain-containing protein [Gorillibacterium sp. sgz5001074]|uniref:helix-turn-helix domain-containing protein n=1 Tax=Gorillibacterium sp. sgz5001074 TaxID=3446695 RepID=UPI003F67C635